MNIVNLPQIGWLDTHGFLVANYHQNHRSYKYMDYPACHIIHLNLNEQSNGHLLELVIKIKIIKHLFIAY